MLEDIKETKYYNLDEVITETNAIAYSEPLSILWNTLHSPNVRKTYLRSYMKIQNLFADIGGIINAFFIILTTVSTHYIKYNFIMNIREDLNPKKSNYEHLRKCRLLNLESGKNLFNLFEKKETNDLKSNQKTEEDIKDKDTNKNKKNNKNCDNNSSKNKQNYSDNINCKKSSKNIFDNEKPKNTIDILNTVSNNFILNSSHEAEKYEDSLARDEIKPVKIEIKSEKKINFFKETEKEEESRFLFKSLDFEKLSYFNFIYAMVCCKKEISKPYNQINKEIHGLLDIFSFCHFLKHQYLIQDPVTIED